MSKWILVALLFVVSIGSNTFAQCPADILIMGDSHVARGRWSEAFDMPVCKMGVRGIATSAVAPEIHNWIKGDPSVIIIMLGTNDLYRDGLSVDEIITHYITILDYIESNHPTAEVIVNSLFPPIKWRAGYLADVLEFNRQLEELAAERGYVFIDIFTPLADGTGFIGREFGYTHLNSRGYEVWYEILEGGI